MFNEPVTVGPSPLSVFDSAGAAIGVDQVGTAMGVRPHQTPTGRGTSWPPIGLRWLLFAGFALALAVAGARSVPGSPTPPRRLRPSLPPILSWTRLAASAGLVAVAGLGLLLASDAGWGAPPVNSNAGPGACWPRQPPSPSPLR